MALRPATDLQLVLLRQQQTSEAISLIEASVEPDLGDATDVSEAAELAGRGSALDTRSLAQIERTIRAGVTARRALGDRDEIPALLGLVAGIDPSLLSVAAQIDLAVEEDGSDLRDAASPTLRPLRRELRDGRGGSPTPAPRARSGRRRAPAGGLRHRAGGRPGARRQGVGPRPVPGIVHDASGSGQTLFVEPFALVETDNRLREAAGAEREEVERILRELSALVGERAEALDALVERARQSSISRSRAASCRGVWHGSPVASATRSRLLGARHPLLDPATAVPIDLDLGSAARARLSGPNTGGKTVALKTLGLAALLHQCGLRPPADEAALPVFDRGARRHRRRAVDRDEPLDLLGARPATSSRSSARRPARSLVLLDELAAGTDPVEGVGAGAGGRRAARRQARLTVVTTHYAELKEWASAAAAPRTPPRGSTPRRARRSTGSRSAGRARRTRSASPSGSGSTRR